MKKELKNPFVIGTIILIISITISLVAGLYFYMIRDKVFHKSALELAVENNENSYESVRNLVYPVGSIYISFIDDTVAKVEERYGGTWEKIEGRFLLGESSDYAIDTTGGSADAVVVSHNHTFTGSSSTTNNTGGHSHTLQIASQTAKYCALFTQGSNRGGINYGSSVTSSATLGFSTAGAHTHTVTMAGTVGTTGVAASGKNMPPYLVAYMYKRTE